MIKEKIKKMIKKYLPLSVIKEVTLENYMNYVPANPCFSQEGEDMILARYFESKQSGFFIDVGAHHPIRFSNTYKFYLKGWRGINIDAMPGSMSEFNNIRPEDINLEIPVSDSSEILTYYSFNEPALNTFSKSDAIERDGQKGYRIIDTKELLTQKLCDILKQYLPADKEIDFLSIDVEGLDLKVLKSNDWEKYRPTYVLAECLHKGIEEVIYDEISLFMRSVNYNMVAKSCNTVFFKTNL